MTCVLRVNWLLGKSQENDVNFEKWFDRLCTGAGFSQRRIC